MNREAFLCPKPIASSNIVLLHVLSKKCPFTIMTFLHSSTLLLKTLSRRSQVKSGRWKGGQLEAPLDLWQCTNAAEGAAEAMAAARK
jgi:hypothetical protein